MASSLKIGFDVPFYQAIKAATDRGVELPDVYYSTEQGIKRQLAFSISGIASVDQLQIVRDSLAIKLVEGATFAEWKKDILENGNLGLPAHRLENIYRTNLQGNYNRGRWQRFQSVKADMPYLMYDAIDDSRVRPTHLAMDGIIRPVDDKFWNEHYPPNGYQCRCRCIALNQRQATARSNGDNGLNKPVNADDMRPDKGWDYNPGKDITAGVDQALQDHAMRRIVPIKSADEAIAKGVKRWAEFLHVSEDELKSTIDKKLRDELSGSDIFLRTNKKALADIFDKEVILNSSGIGDIPTFSKSIISSFRENFEAAILGVPVDQKVRPIYGYAAKDGGGMLGKNYTLDSFGDIAIKLKKAVTKRSSVSGKSMLSAVSEYNPSTAPQPITAPNHRILKWNSTPGKDNKIITDIKLEHELDYFEAQIMDGLKIDDIDEVIFKDEPSQKLQKIMSKKKVSWRIADEVTSLDYNDDLPEW